MSTKHYVEARNLRWGRRLGYAVGVRHETTLGYTSQIYNHYEHPVDTVDCFRQADSLR